MLSRLAESLTQVLHIDDYEETSNDLQRRVIYFELIRGSRRKGNACGKGGTVGCPFR